MIANPKGNSKRHFIYQGSKIIQGKGTTNCRNFTNNIHRQHKRQLNIPYQHNITAQVSSDRGDSNMLLMYKLSCTLLCSDGE